VAAFGSIMLMRYHDEFLRSVPAGIPSEAMPYLLNPVLLNQSRDKLAAILMKTPGGFGMVQPLIASVKTSLMHGLQGVFFYGAAIMSLAVVLHLFLKREPLRTRSASTDTPVAAAAH
jgi:hypothetical protein